MARLSAFAEAEQLSIDDVLAEFRDEAPPEAAREGRKEPSAIAVGMDPDVIMADIETLGDVSHLEIGSDPHHNGLCPFYKECETRRRRLPTYRPGHSCHWVAWRNVADCPIFQQNGGAK